MSLLTHNFSLGVLSSSLKIGLCAWHIVLHSAALEVHMALFVFLITKLSYEVVIDVAVNTMSQIRSWSTGNHSPKMSNWKVS